MCAPSRRWRWRDSPSRLSAAAHRAGGKGHVFISHTGNSRYIAPLSASEGTKTFYHMAKYIEMPQLADTMTEGTVVRWLVKEGDKITAGQEIAEIETDKATMGYEALDDGLLHKLLVPAGQKVACGTPLALLLGKNEEAPKDGALPPVGKTAPTASAPAAKAEPALAGTATTSPSRAALEGTPRAKASPLARKIATAQGVQIAGLVGTGPGGRIIARDVQNGAVAAKPAAAGAAAIPSMPAGEGDTEIPLTGMRRVIAERLLASKTTIPHFYLTMDVDCGALMKIRAEANVSNEATGGPKLTVNDFVLKAVVSAAEKVPAVNASFAGDSIIQYGDINLSVAVAVDDGLVTPVIRAAQKKSLREISESVKDLAGRARSKKLKPDEYQGGTITVSNLGAYGVESFCAIINPPQAMILAIGAITKQPVVGANDQITVAQRMKITLSGDHRVVDGAVGATYLGELKKLIENPALMLL